MAETTQLQEKEIILRTRNATRKPTGKPFSYLKSR